MNSQLERIWVPDSTYCNTFRQRFINVNILIGMNFMNIGQSMYNVQFLPINAINLLIVD